MIRAASSAALAALVLTACAAPTTEYDVVILNGRVMDPETETDVADYKIGTNGLPSTGIPYALVNGTAVVRDSEVVEGVFPGQPIRCSVEAKGRFEPLAKEKYLDTLLVARELPDLADEALGQGHP